MSIKDVSSVGTNNSWLEGSTGFLSCPPDLIRNILIQKGLGLEDVLHCSLVSKTIRQIACSEELWQLLFYLHFGQKLPLECYPRQVYQNQYRYSYNVGHGVYASKTFGSPKDSPVYFLDATREGQLVSTHFDRTIKIWDLNTEVYLHKFEGWKGIITNIAYSPDKTLISVSGNGELTCWKEESGLWNCTKDVFWDDEGFRTVIFIGEHFFVAPRDGTIQGYNWESGQLEINFQGDGSQIGCFANAGGKLISGSDHGIIAIWDVGNVDCRVLESHAYGVTALKVEPKRPWILGAGFDNGDVKVWDLTNDRCIWDLKNKSLSSIKDLVFEKGELFVKYLNRTEAWNWLSDKPCYTIKNQGKKDSECFGTSFVNGKLYTGCVRGGIQVRDFKASNDAVLKEIAALFRSKNLHDVTEAKERLQRMPGAIRHQIENVECKAILGTAFGSRDLEPEEMAQAIDNYIIKFSGHMQNNFLI